MMCLGMTWFQLKGDMIASLTTSVLITRHAALNVTASICQTICVVASHNVLERLVQYEQKGEVGCFIRPKGENSMAMSGANNWHKQFA